MLLRPRRTSDDEALLWLLAIALVTTLLMVLAGQSRAADLATLSRWGLPEGTPRQQGEFVFAYDGRTRCPRWTLECLDTATLAGSAERNATFAADESIPTEFRALLPDYQSSGLDRGHCAAFANYGNPAAAKATFLLSNAAPQNKSLNRGLWKQLEQRCRSLVTKDNQVWIATIPLWNNDGEFIRAHRIGDSRVWVPTHFAKTVLILRAGEKLPADRFDVDPHDFVEPLKVTSALQAWIAPNTEPRAGEGIDDWAVTVDELERASGLDLWSELPDALEEKLEAGK